MDFFNLQGGEGLSMPLLFGISFPPLHLEGDHLLGPALAQDFSHDLDIGKQRSSGENLLSFRVKKNVRKFYGLAGIALYLFDLNGVAGGNFILFSTRPDYCVHVILPKLKLNIYLAEPAENTEKNPRFLNNFIHFFLCVLCKSHSFA